MSQIKDFFYHLFDYSSWPPRWECGEWSSFHGWLYIVSDMIIWLAYFLIPIVIFNYVRKQRDDLRFSAIYLLFAFFILLCGTTHLLDVVMFWAPMYRLSALIRFATAVVSLLTVYYLLKSLPDFFQQRTYNAFVKEKALREEAERKLAIANADLEKFAYVASHDMQEPLRKITLFSEMLEERNTETFDSRSVDLIQKIIRSSHKMQRLITDVLSLSKLTQDITPVEVSIQEVVDRALEDLEGKIVDREANISTENLPFVLGNEAYLQQLFYNLIGNAIKFSTEKPQIRISGRTQGDDAFISVTDSGIGIEQEHFEQIFLPFQRLNGSVQFDGSGIGLSLCKKIVEIHGGEINVESEPGIGSLFTVKLKSSRPEIMEAQS